MKILKCIDIEGARHDKRLSPEARLVIEIVNLCPDISIMLTTWHYGTLVKRYGSVEAALAAIARGEILFDRVPDEV